MSVWNWVFESLMQARASDDPDMQQLCRLQEQSSKSREDPPGAIAACEQGIALARRVGLPWWEVYFYHWKLQTLMNVVFDYRQAPELAVRATLRAQKPDCAACPQRICVHEDLISIYLDSDPVGHADRIEQALDYMERELTDDLECQHCFLADRSTFALALDQVAEAEVAARQLLSVLANLPYRQSAHHEMTAFGKLCQIAYRRQAWTDLRSFAEEGELRKMHCRRPAQVAEFLAWQALANRKLGQEERGVKLATRARKHVATTGCITAGTYYEALCAFHEHAREHAAALAIRDEELTIIGGKGMTLREATARMSRCRLLAALGQPTYEAAAQTRQVLSGLRKPESLLAELNQIATDPATQPGPSGG